ncbi:MAG TPA: hypothetical protein VGC30_07950 [Dokdonella sp.]
MARSTAQSDTDRHYHGAGSYYRDLIDWHTDCFDSPAKRFGEAQTQGKIMTIRNFVAACLLMVFQHAFAFSPTTGLWWNPNEGGRGYEIDVQNDTMTVTVYAYDRAAQPLWYLASGIYDDSNHTFTGDMYTYSGGQCFGCAFSGATASRAGTIRIVFSDWDKATLYFPGGSTPIEHFQYGFASKQDFLLGEWSFSTDTYGLGTAQWIVFGGHYTGSDGTVYVSGTGDGDAHTIALGQYSDSLGLFVVVAIDAAGYSHSYALQGDDRRMLGEGELEPPNVSPTGNGVPAAASRLLYLSELSSAKAAVAADRDLGRLEAAERLVARALASAVPR